ncbi:restriction endonuclease [Filifactor villosus]|uniref:Restriction endonuclease n=1 Tax=Filifactor villosus TaxID=29374 RepID=A0ABV9QI26_9FIRM
MKRLYCKNEKKSHDYGADLIISKNGETIAVQAKRYRNKVGIKAIQEAVASMKVYSCNRAMVITNSYYTKSALELATGNQ